MSVTTLPSRIGRRIAHQRAIGELHRELSNVVARGRTPRRSGGKRIGIASFGHGEWHLAYELLIAHALERRGAAPELLVCDLPELPLCSERLVNSTSQQRCGACLDVKRGLLDAGAMPWRGLSEFVAGATLDRARRIADAIDHRDIDSYRERNYPIGRWLHVSACHFLRCDARGDAPEKVATRRRLLATAIVGVDAVERWLTNVAPEVVLVQGGAHTLPRIARELARARGIPVISRELGKGGWDRQIFALDHDCMAPDLDEAWSVARDQPLTPQEDAEVDALSARLCADTYLPPGNRHTAAALQIDAATRTAVAFTNVTWDLATADRDVAFTGILDWLTETMSALAPHPDVQLVIRAHPAEASVMTRERVAERIAAAWPRAPGVVVIAPEHPVAARELFARADLVVAYNSTAGLEAAMHDKRVILCGAPHFRGRGFTVDIEQRDQYRDILRSWARHGNGGGRGRGSVSAFARRYFHLFFARYHIPVGWTTSPLEPPYRLRITALDDLDAGRNSAVDLICDGIINGRQILRPRAEPEAACRP